MLGERLNDSGPAGVTSAAPTLTIPQPWLEGHVMAEQETTENLSLRQPAVRRALQRLFGATEQVGQCLLRIHFRNDGYSQFRFAGRNGYAHRFSYECFIGPVERGFEIDHLCRKRHCVNPMHLEAVTSAVNTLRGIGPTASNARKTSCTKGHPFDAGNTYLDKRGRRYCRICEREKCRRVRARRHLREGGCR